MTKKPEITVAELLELLVATLKAAATCPRPWWSSRR